MKSKLVYLVFSGCVILLACIWGIKTFQKAPAISQPRTNYLSHYYFPITVSKLDLTNTPHVSLSIEGKTIAALLDLGFRGQVALSPEILSTISQKTYLGPYTKYGIRGTAFECAIYALPKIEMDPLICSNIEVEEDSQPFHQEALFAQNGPPSSPIPLGMIGWEFFTKTNLFLDLTNSTIAVCDSLSTLQNEGYSIDTFIKVPLLVDRGLVEFEGEMLGNSTRFMLDTGASVNFINTPLEEGVSMESMLWEPENFLSVPSVKAGGQDLGPMDFRRIPIKLPVAIEAILGMDFFEEHMVFLDFAGGYIYFAKSISNDSNDAPAHTSENDCHPDLLQSAS